MIFRQTRALVVVLFRNWTRRARRLGDSPKRGFPVTFVLNLIFLLYFAPVLWKNGLAISQLGEFRSTGTRLGLYGIILLNASSALTLISPEMGKLRLPLRHSLLDELPVSPFPIMIATWLQSAPYIIISGAFLLGLSPELNHSPLGISYLTAFLLLLSLSACALGMALVSLIRALLPAHVRSKLTFLSVAGMLFGFLLLSFSKLAASLSWLTFDPWSGVFEWLAEFLTGPYHSIGSLAAIGLVATAALGITTACELRGYDRIDSAPPVRPNDRVKGALDMARVERLLGDRETGKRFAFILFILLGAALIFGQHAMKSSAAIDIPVLMATNIVYLSSMLTLQFASTMVKRDVDARALLSTLPIEPYQTLAGKVSALRRRLVPLAMLALIVLGMMVPRLGLSGVLWRGCIFYVSLWLLCDAGVSISFLSRGLGAAAAMGASGGASFATTLLMFPFIMANLSTNPFSALISLAMLWAISREAKRSAEKCVRWLDDSGDVERESEIWRALLVLSAFFATQGLVAQMLKFIGLSISDGRTLAVTYGISAIVLALLTYRERARLPLLVLWPKKPLALLLGLGGGALTAFGSVRLFRLITDHDLLPEGWLPKASEAAPTQGVWMVAVAVIIVAPIAEEFFFRGWLQTAIANQLSPQKRRRAILYGALVFAGIHVGSLYLPQFALGLIAGALYFWSGGLLPGILAHAMHNGLATWLGK